MHPGDLYEPSRAERRIEIGDADTSLEFRFPKVGPGGWRRLYRVRVVGKTYYLEEWRWPGRLLRFGNEVLVIGAFFDRVGLDEILTDCNEGRTGVVQHHIDRRIGACRVYFCDLIDGQHWVEHDRGIGIRLAERRNQHRLVCLLPASSEGGKDQWAGLGVAQSRERLHGAERQCCR